MEIREIDRTLANFDLDPKKPSIKKNNILNSLEHFVFKKICVVLTL